MPHLAMRAKAHFGLTPLDFGLGRRTASETDRPRSRAPQLGAATFHSFTGVLKLLYKRQLVQQGGTKLRLCHPYG